MSALVKDTRKKKELLLLAFPGLIFLFLFAYIPMFGVFIAFKDINYAKGIFGSDWVGFKNFEFFFKTGTLSRLTRNTVLLNLMFTVVGTSVSILFAILLYEVSRKAVKVYQTILFMPFLLSWVVASYVTDIFLNHRKGVLNIILSAIGLDSAQWYFVPSYWPFILLFVSIWKGLGYSAIIYYTNLMGIDSEYYEAAALDGANRFQQITRISLPMIFPLVVLLFILSIGKIFSADFGLFYFVTRDSPMIFSTTDVVDTFVYRTLRTKGDIGMSSAVAFVQSVVGCVLLIATNFFVRRISPEKSLF